MRSKWFVFILIVTCAALIGGWFLFIRQNMNTPSIKVNNKIILCKQADVTRRYATMPLIEVLSACDVKIEWLNQNDALISHEDTTFILSLSQQELIDEDSRNNWLLQPPGSTYYFCEQVGTEIIIDDCTMSNVLHGLGIRTEMSINYRNREVSIKKMD